MVVEFYGAGDGLRGFAPCPFLASSVGQKPKNVPLARFLNGFSPHRFEPLSVVGNKNDQGDFPWSLYFMERVTGFEPANASLGSSCLTTWRHPHG